MPTFADQWNANPPPDIHLFPHARIITVSGVSEDVQEVRVDELNDYDMEDAAALTIVADVRGVRQQWVQYKTNTDIKPEQWGDAMDIDYELSSGGYNAVTVVVDTNILLSYLERLQTVSEFLCAAGGSHSLELVIPGIVLQELDAQTKFRRATNPNLPNLAQGATYWLLLELKKRKEGKPCLVRIQKDHETRIGGLSWKGANAINDDLILDCCQYFSDGLRPVYLLTDDKNLFLKAEANDVHAIPGNRLRDPWMFIGNLVPFANKLSPSKKKAIADLSRSSNRVVSYTPPHTPIKERGRSPEKLRLSSLQENRVVEGSMDIDMSHIQSPHSASTSVIESPIETTADDPKHPLKKVKRLFLEYLANELPTEVHTLLTMRRASTNSRSRGFADGAHPSHAWQSWSPQQCLMELKKIPPVKPPVASIDWACLSSFLAQQGESGYRANGGGRGDWLKALRMLQLLANAYALECLNDQALQMCQDAMELAIGLHPSQ